MDIFLHWADNGADDVRISCFGTVQHADRKGGHGCGSRLAGTGRPPVAVSHIDYLAAHPQTVCIATGGKAEGENITEAECIKNELVKKGIDSERIICENKAVDTDTNLEYSAKIIEERGLDKNIVIVTESYHQMRGALYAKRFGLNPTAVSSHTPFALQCSAWVREMIGLVKFVLVK